MLQENSPDATCIIFDSIPYVPGVLLQVLVMYTSVSKFVATTSYRAFVSL